MAFWSTRMAEDDDALDEYLLGVVLQGAMQFVLQRPDSSDGDPDYHPLDAGHILGNGQPTPKEDVPNTSYREIITYFSEVRWRMYA